MGKKKFGDRNSNGNVVAKREKQCLNCRGGRLGGLNPPTVFSTPPNILSNYVQGGSYTLYAYGLHHNFGRAPTIEKLNPKLIFHNSNTGEEVKGSGNCHPPPSLSFRISDNCGKILSGNLYPNMQNLG